MKISYYFSSRIRAPGLNLVGISNTHPKGLAWLQGLRTYQPLCPGWDLVKTYKNGKISQDEYEYLYHEEILNRLDPSKVYEDLGEDAILLCWEKPGVFCHRRIVAQWLYDNLHIKVSEL